ncbi:hypothetical protein [Actinomycetospora cinnamomea]|uniref:4-amino-4-deoxy-L-arabinose transferase-like glycosyltransferase n=1 Tax=Actinomycetospora cinnamomea TaxID=663609 RepID=A0A2U1EWG2_9PSEU|nr:hypothetical protein [Actinomycetospora cinnamomea]PVZ04249.1 hypothetical protein C8D89_11837 [Actinomycetospora cinnamomea]
MTSLSRTGATPAPVAHRVAFRRPRVATLLLLAGSVALAAASLGVPAALGYDPWAWLVWGREATRGTVSTAGGPTWKPLPVLVTTPLSYAGDAAPELWLVLARAGGLVAMGLTYRLAARTAAGLGPDGSARFVGPVAGLVAVLALLLGPDAESRWIRLVLQGNVEPLLVALCLGAVLCHLDRRPGVAVALGAAACLLRPEAWPFLVLYSVWLLVAHRDRWPVLLPLLVAVVATAPVLWLGGDWLISGDPWSGATRAQVLEGDAAERLVATSTQLGGVVLVPVWVAAAVGVSWSVRRRAWTPVVLAVAALVWIAMVAAMASLLGYAALSRFLAPPGAVLCVLAGTGIACSLAAIGHRGLRLAVAVLLIAAMVPFALPRVGWLPRQVAEAGERARLEEDLDRAVALAGGRDALLRCGTLAIDATRPIDLQARPGLSWTLDVPLASVGYSSGGRPGVVILRTGDPAAGGLDARVLATTERWTVLAVGCPAP